MKSQNFLFPSQMAEFSGKQVSQNNEGFDRAVFLGDDILATSVVNGGHVIVWDLTPVRKSELPVIINEIKCEDISCKMTKMTHDKLAVGSTEGVVVWNWRTNEIQDLKGHLDVVNSVAFMAKSRRLVSASEDQIIIWDLDRMKPRSRTSMDEILSLFPLPNDTLVVKLRESLKIWSPEEGVLFSYEYSYCVGFNLLRERNHMAFGSLNDIIILNYVTGELRKIETENGIEDLVALPDGSFICASEESIRVLDSEFRQKAELRTTKGKLVSGTSELKFNFGILVVIPDYMSDALPTIWI